MPTSTPPVNGQGLHAGTSTHTERQNDPGDPDPPAYPDHDP
ncbi:hypothetical protein BH10PSE15_BH10PSE15_05700 [soil metagenome]